jgi:hypothetical protein
MPTARLNNLFLGLTSEVTRVRVVSSHRTKQSGLHAHVNETQCRVHKGKRKVDEHNVFNVAGAINIAWRKPEWAEG